MLFLEIWSTHRNADDGLDTETASSFEGVLNGVLEEPMEAGMTVTDAEPIEKSNFKMRA